MCGQFHGLVPTSLALSMTFRLACPADTDALVAAGKCGTTGLPAATGIARLVAPLSAPVPAHKLPAAHLPAGRVPILDTMAASPLAVVPAVQPLLTKPQALRAVLVTACREHPVTMP